MWQRKQTLFLATAILINISLFFLDLAIIKSGEFSGAFGMYGAEALQEGSQAYSSMILAIVISVSMLLSLATISQFKKRPIQVKLAQFNLLIQIAFIIALFFVIEQAMDAVKIEGPVPMLVYTIGAYLAVIPLFFMYLAIRFIKKDEALVRAADRIR